jgi:hypothetical protein
MGGSFGFGEMMEHRMHGSGHVWKNLWRWPAHRIVGCLVSLAVMTGCVEQNVEPKWDIPSGAAGIDAAVEFVDTLAQASVIDFYCRSYGIKKTYSNTREVVARFADDMRTRGFSQAELKEMEKRISSEIASLEYRYRERPSKGEIAGLCQSAKREIAAGSDLGRVLTTF